MKGVPLDLRNITPGPYVGTLDTKNKIITIEYDEHIVDEPGIVENIKSIAEAYAPYIEESIKQTV